MSVQALSDVFANAALPQKIVLLALLAALPFVIAASVFAVRGTHRLFWSRIVADLRFIGPATGLLVAGLNAFHMGETIQRLDPTLKQIAPGIFEASVFVSLGALVGLVAAAALASISLRAPPG